MTGGVFTTRLWEFRLVFSHLVAQHVTLRYRRTALGFLWTLINPLLTMVITSVIFSLMMRMPLQSFAVFLFAGLIPFTLFSQCILQGGNSILENEGLIKKIYIPRQIFVFARCTGLLIDAFLSFCCLFVIAAVIGAHLTASLLILPLAFLLVFVFGLGLALCMSIMSVYFRDAAYIVGILLQAAYYLTPIIYPLSIVPEKYRLLFIVNPMYYFVELFRKPIYEGVFPDLATLGIAISCAVLSLLLGTLVFQKFDRDVIFRL
ncbi:MULTISPECIES: ABC transporter permease [Ramlibacter]|nr:MULTISPECIES: ABC transporter permease [Ramlibacter]MBA2964835.1 ABC transporter permease [Ramlibacter sp. CGMCC 1.13660]